MRKTLSWLAEYEKAHGKGEFKATWQKEREKKGWFFFFFGDREGTGINARMENSTWYKRDYSY